MKNNLILKTFVEWKLEIVDFSNVFDKSNLRQYLSNSHIFV